MGRKRIRTDAEREALLNEQAQLVARALRDSVDTTPMRDGPATTGGDPKRLRGIPAIGRNVQGHVPGTHPEQATLRASARDC